MVHNPYSGAQMPTEYDPRFSDRNHVNKLNRKRYGYFA